MRKASICFFMDSDDEIIPTCIEILVHKMQEHPVDFIAASHMKKDLSGKTYPTYTYSPILIQGDDLPVAQYRYAQNNDIYVMSWNKLYNLNFSDYPFMHLLYSQLLVCQRVCLQNTVCLICK